MAFFGKKIPLGFSSSSTAEEVTQGIDGTGLTAIVTGATSGIGLETARVLALHGVQVVVGARNVAAAADVKKEIIKKIPDAKLDILELDLGSMASVRKFVSDFDSLGLPLNILINNAGVLTPHFTLSQDNIELHFATNHMGHFILTELLLDKMKISAQESRIEGRIVNVSSRAHYLTYREGIQFDQINGKPGYRYYLAYGQSKLANILHSNELSRRLKEQGAPLTANSLTPGPVYTNIFKHNHCLDGLLSIFGRLFWKSIQQGASTTCYVALHPQLKGVSGKYFVNCEVAKPSSQAQDIELARKLWDFSLSLMHGMDRGI